MTPSSSKLPLDRRSQEPVRRRICPPARQGGGQLQFVHEVLRCGEMDQLKTQRLPMDLHERYHAEGCSADPAASFAALITDPPYASGGTHAYARILLCL